MGAENKSRRATRKPADIRVHLEGPQGSGTVLMSRDWSYTGVFLRTNQPLPVGTHLAMSAVVGRPPRKLHMRGRVMRIVRDTGEKTRPVVGMGIALDSMPPELKTFLGHIADGQEVRPEPYTQRPASHDVDVQFDDERDADEKTEPLKAPLFVLNSDDEQASLEILIVGRPSRRHATAVRDLTAFGVGVVEAAGVAQAIKALRDGDSPSAIVLYDEHGRMLENLLPHFSLGMKPRLVISYGAAPKEPRGGYGFPVLSLPWNSEFDRILEAARMFAPDESESPGILSNSEDGRR